jgi:hypothetical protein
LLAAGRLGENSVARKYQPAANAAPLPGFKRQIVGDQTYYVGDKPNPHLAAFLQKHAIPLDPSTDGYSVAAFNRAIETSRATSIYNLHRYWSKKPHDAVQQYIAHYTSPGHVVLDPFCDSGGTELAALASGRKAIAIDRSPAATFIASQYCSPTDLEELATAAREVERQTRKEIEWLYETRCDRCSGPATTSFTVFSQVHQCPRCLTKITFFDCLEVESQTSEGKPKTVRVCPHCHGRGHLEIIRAQSTKYGPVPVQTVYACMSRCKPARGVRLHNDPDENKRRCFEQYDLGKLEEIESTPIPHWYPKGYDMTTFDRYQRDALRLYGVKEVADLFTKRSLWALSAVREALEKIASPTSNSAASSLWMSISTLSLNGFRMLAEE